MSTKQMDFEIENVGGVEHVTLRLAPGVNVLRGRNAAGKTSALRAVVRAQGGEIPIERRDGSERGVVSGPGVTLSVRQVVHTTGEAEMALADVGPLARLIDPGIKDTDAAARARIRALIELLDLGVDDESLSLLCATNDPEVGSLGIVHLYDWLRDEVQEEAIDDLMRAAEKLRQHAHALARDQEEKARDSEARAKAAGERAEILRKSLDEDEGIVDTTPDDAKAALETAVRHHDRAAAQLKARQELEEKQKNIRATIGARPDIEGAKASVARHRDSEEQARQHIEALRSQLARAEEIHAAKKVALNREIVALEEARAAAVAWDERDAILRQPLTGPTLEEVDALEAECKRAIEHLEDAQDSAACRAEEEARVSFERTQREAAKEAKRYRSLAAGIPARLGKILARAGAPGLTVVDGRLHAIRGDERKDYEHRCSTGERVALALDVAATAYRGRVLPLDGSFWTALDPEHRAAFARLAHERGLYVLTEEPTDGELRVEEAGA